MKVKDDEIKFLDAEDLKGLMSIDDSGGDHACLLEDIFQNVKLDLLVIGDKAFKLWERLEV